MCDSLLTATFSVKKRLLIHSSLSSVIIAGTRAHLYAQADLHAQGQTTYIRDINECNIHQGTYVGYLRAPVHQSS